MEKIFELGFVLSAEFVLNEDTLNFKILKNQNSKNILYAFTSLDGENDFIFYIGHTRKTFKNRMDGYRLGYGLATNNRVHSYAKNQIELGREIKVYVLNNVLNLSLRDLDIDIAAGLEYSLISFYSLFNSDNNLPELLNRAGNLNKIVLSTSDIKEDPEDNLDYAEHELNTDPEIQNVSFNYDLSSKTYWEYPSINIPIALQNYFGDHNDEVIVDFIKAKVQVTSLNVLINRKAVPNGSPRLYFTGVDGRWVQNWKHSNFNRNSILKINIVGVNHIQIVG